jgi:hypothetical protein
VLHRDVIHMWLTADSATAIFSLEPKPASVPPSGIPASDMLRFFKSYLTLRRARVCMLSCSAHASSCTHQQARQRSCLPRSYCTIQIAWLANLMAIQIAMRIGIGLAANGTHMGLTWEGVRDPGANCTISETSLICIRGGPVGRNSEGGSAEG